MEIGELGPNLASLQDLVDSVPALIHTSRPDGYLDFFNDRWFEYVGLRLEDLEGWKWTAVIHPDDVNALVAKWRACLVSGEPFEFESRVRRADGAYRWMWHQKLPLRNAGGEIVKWYGSSVDIDDRKRAEYEVRKHETVHVTLEAQLQATLNIIPAYTWYAAPSGTEGIAITIPAGPTEIATIENAIARSRMHSADMFTCLADQSASWFTTGIATTPCAARNPGRSRPLGPSEWSPVVISETTMGARLIHAPATCGTCANNG
jgi:PAS domain S-box-containing protein